MYKIIKGQNLKPEQSFKIYCFPDIPSEHQAESLNCADREPGFHRFGFEENHPIENALPESAGKKPEDLIEEIRRRSETIEKKAYMEGLSQGEREGIELGKKKLEPVVHNFQRALLDLNNLRRKIYEDAEREVVDLALTIAKKVICQEIATKKGIIMNVVKEALKKVVDQDVIKVKISPSDLQYIKNSNLEETDFGAQSRNITFEADDALLEGGCIIETSFGDIDARIEQQLQAVEEALRAQFHRVSSQE